MKIGASRRFTTASNAVLVEGELCQHCSRSVLEAPQHIARTVHNLYFEPKYEEFRSRTMWNLSNAFTSSLKELDPHPPIQGHREVGYISVSSAGMTPASSPSAMWPSRRGRRASNQDIKTSLFQKAGVFR